MFNLDIPEQVQEAVFSGKAIATNPVTVYFNNVYFKLNLFGHIHEKIKKASKGFNVMRKMNLPWTVFPFGKI